MSMPGLGELIVIFMIVLVLFGAGKIPEIAKNMGSGIRDFKKAMNGEFEDEKEESKQNDKKKK